ncbi:MAG: hypothetical protein WD009_01755 [Phycisphaeraceae bacterium]
MSFLHPGAESAAVEYLTPDTIRATLGAGIDGIVYSSSRATAIKVHAQEPGFNKELAVYQRLAEHRVRHVDRFAVPELLGFSRRLRIIEMSIVRPPYVLDFASSYLDQPPDFPSEHWEHWQQQRAEEFGDDWPTALSLYATMRRRWGVYHLDLSPRNVNFGDTLAR